MIFSINVKITSNTQSVTFMHLYSRFVQSVQLWYEASGHTCYDTYGPRLRRVGPGLLAHRKRVCVGQFWQDDSHFPQKPRPQQVSEEIWIIVFFINVNPLCCLSSISPFLLVGRYWLLFYNRQGLQVYVYSKSFTHTILRDARCEESKRGAGVAQWLRHWLTTTD